MKKILSVIFAVLLLSGVASAAAFAEQLPYKIGVSSDNEFSGDVQLYYANYGGVKLSEPAAAAYPALASALDTWSRTMLDGAKTAGNDIIEAAKLDLASGGSFYGPYYQTEYAEVLRADSRFFSVMLSGYEYTGGVHGIPFRTAVCFESQTGRVVRLHELIANLDAFTGLVLDELSRQYPGLSQMKNATMLLADTEQPLTFVVDNVGLTVFFGAYSLGSYAEGEQVVTIPYAGNESVFAVDLLPEDGEHYTVIAPNSVYNFDLNSDGTAEQMSLYFSRDEYDIINSVSVIIGEDAAAAEIEAFDVLPIVITRPNGESYLYIKADGFSDWQVLECFRLNAEGAEYLGCANVSFGGMWDGSMNYTDIPAGDVFQLYTRCSVLGTKGTNALFTVGDDGMPVMLDKIWHITNPMPQKVLMSFEASSSEGEPVVIPAGSTVSYIATDSESLCILEMEDGSNIGVNIDRSFWPYTINGMDICEIFENVIFAG